MKIETLMNRKTVTCTPTSTLADAAKMMWNQDIGCIPVVDHNRRPVGMITDRDICMSALHTSRPLNQIQVSQAMSREVYACKTTDPLQAAEDIMAKRQVRRVPVVDQSGQLVGMLSMNDIARASTGAIRLPENVEHREVAHTLSAISQPRTPADRPRA